MARRELPPLDVRHLFAEHRAALLDALATLTPAEWDAPTVCDGWSVNDIASHLVSDDLGVVSRGRDGYMRSFIDTDSWDELVAAINAQNEAWVDATRRLSPRVVLELLRFGSERLATHMLAADLGAMGAPVDWAGPGAAPRWLDVARQYTEEWMHGAQMLEAAGRPLIDAPRLFAPVLAAFAYALPHAYRATDAPDGTHVRFVVDGEAGGGWSVVRTDGAWRLYEFADDLPSSVVALDADTAWRMYTKSLPPDVVRSRARISGDAALGAVALGAVAVLA
jgi:uncharacterized protein (TIGR03083 family)